MTGQKLLPPLPRGSYLYERRHGLQRLLEDQVILERNFSIGLLHFADAAVAKALIGQHIHIRVSGKNIHLAPISTEKKYELDLQ